MRMGCLPWIVGIALLAIGGQKLFTGISNRKQVELTIEELIKEKPEGKWLKVTGGHLEIFNSAYTESFGGSSRELYVPLVTGESDDGPIHLLFRTTDPEIMALGGELEQLESLDESEALLKLSELAASLRPQRDVEGLVQFGLESGKDEDKVKDLFRGELADDCLILEDGKKPSVGLGAMMSLGGVVVLGGTAAFAARKKGPAAA
mgnify:CR=1 FL=1